MPLRIYATALLLSSVLAAGQSSRTPVLVELFTSEGCSSCPPADALLARLERDQPIASANVIVLSEHVDYWDQLGWRDRFSSHATTERQSRYSNRFDLPDIYTPQMVVDGQSQFNGSDPHAASRAIAQAAAHPRAVALRLEPLTLTGKMLSATLHVSSPATADADLYAAIVDPEDITQVRNGENGGKTLRHVGVVRSLTRIGTLRDLNGGPVAFALGTTGFGRPIRLVVFAQSPNQGVILGVVASNLLTSDQKSLALVRSHPGNIGGSRN
ncbi:DUF1223 domain-containing protein [Granulicella sibirica]|uniref:DUF1223 domain-containing protein n=1 Tax=Granulicella sibirica TaxID=2479048 RepID=A0A4V1L5I2_9BACT|nr:DUF1223 domain-containing protein [Granulicella sibirica]RXH55854.1 hypothetical protein GRAN_2711 [Granulicella sibirica]